MYLVKTPAIVKRIFPQYLWQMPSDKRVVYLTFDDGPVPEATPWVLDTLKAADAKATFFCIGNNVALHPTIFQRVIAEGHRIGNHTHSHPSGWRTAHDPYIENVKNAQTLIDSQLFRPPYGRIKNRQAKTLMEQGYQMVMWDILSGDFDPNISAEKCAHNVKQNVIAGSIIVFHDSIKSIDKLKVFLPGLLKELKTDGYSFGLL